MVALDAMSKFAYIFLLLPGMVQAEVMDKELSLFSVWLWVIVGAAGIFFAARFRPWLLLIAVPLLSFFFYVQLSEVTDSSVGPAMLREAGYIYIVSLWAAPVLAVVGAILGWWLRKRHVHTQQGIQPDA